MEPDSAHRRFVLLRARTLERLRRVNSVLAAWDEYEAAEAMPTGLRPKVRRPLLERDALQSLRAMLVGVLGEIEEMWARRN